MAALFYIRFPSLPNTGFRRGGGESFFGRGKGGRRIMGELENRAFRIFSFYPRQSLSPAKALNGGVDGRR